MGLAIHFQGQKQGCKIQVAPSKPTSIFLEPLFHAQKDTAKNDLRLKTKPFIYYYNILTWSDKNSRMVLSCWRVIPDGEPECPRSLKGGCYRMNQAEAENGRHDRRQSVLDGSANMPLISRIAADDTLDAAFHWVCSRRVDYSHNSDIWELRRNWHGMKPAIQHALLSGEYMFSPLQEIRTDTDVIELWRARDALVLKAMSMVLGEWLDGVISCRCHHVQGHGGAKAAICNTINAMGCGDHVMKSDIKGYYASIDHHVLYTLAEKYIPDRIVLRLIWQYLVRTVCFGENYREITRGISLGCPLSPLMGALYLKPLDDAVAETGLSYARFMDDWVIVAPSRWKLRKAVRIVNQTLTRLKVEKHPDKTFIGRVEKGFDFLGYHLKPESLAPSCQTIKKHAEQICRLYEQGAGIDRIRQYIWRWSLWLKFGFGQLKTLFLGIQISFMASLRLFFFKG